MHDKNVLNTLTLYATKIREPEIIHVVAGKYVNDGNIEGFLLEFHDIDNEDYLQIAMINKQGETLKTVIPINEISENQAILTVNPKTENKGPEKRETQIYDLFKEESSKRNFDKWEKCPTDWLSIAKWQPSSNRVDMSKYDNILKVTYSPNPLYKWDNIVQYFNRRYPGVDWSHYNGIGMWIYPDNEGFTEISLWILHSYGHVRGKESVKKALNLVPYKWNYVFIDFTEFKFDFRDVWAIEFILNADCFREKNKNYIFYIGDFFMIKEKTGFFPYCYSVLSKIINFRFTELMD